MTTIRNSELKNVTREAVLGAIEECRSLGVQAFLEKHGYGPSKTFQIRYQGQSFPMKAIMGVAAGLRHDEFFSGAEHLVKHVTRCGFQVRQGRRVVTALGLLNLAKERASEARETFELPELPVEPVSFFASGTNRTGEIRGMAAVGQDVGVVAGEIVGREPAEKELHALAGTDINVFVDSGAFSEVEITKDGIRTVDPITPARWESIFALYDRLAATLGPQAFLVAPDKIGDQDETLRRLETYRGRLAALAAKGARILVPVQKGALTQAAVRGEGRGAPRRDRVAARAPLQEVGDDPRGVRGLRPRVREARPARPPPRARPDESEGARVPRGVRRLGRHGLARRVLDHRERRPRERRDEREVEAAGAALHDRAADRQDGARRALRRGRLPQERVARARADPLLRDRLGPLHGGLR
jgi:hypothetical protein